MKKYIVVLIFAITFSSVAQDFRIGLTLAPTISFNKNTQKNTDGKWVTIEGSGGLGWKGGLLADYNFAGNYNLHSGLLIHSKSFNTDNYSGSVTTVEIPLALKLRSKEVTDNVHITGFFGSTLDLNVNAKYTDNDGNEVNVKDYYNKLGFSFMAGVGAEYDLDFGSVGIGLSYHLGLTNIVNDNTISETVPKHLSIDLVFYF
jgi:hypothetical protein